MAKEFADDFYCSGVWKSCREKYKKSVGGLCERCRAKGEIVAGVIVHHKKYLTPDNINDPNVTLNWDNLELLCRQCHEDEHNNKVSHPERFREKRYTVDEFGRVTAQPPSECN